VKVVRGVSRGRRGRSPLKNYQRWEDLSLSLRGQERVVLDHRRIPAVGVSRGEGTEGGAAARRQSATNEDPSITPSTKGARERGVPTERRDRVRVSSVGIVRSGRKTGKEKKFSPSCNRGTGERGEYSARRGKR